MKLYVGNLPFDVNDDALRSLFEQFGAVGSASVINDRETGRSRGFGFVEMDENSAAEEAIEQLNGNDFNGRPLVVNQARPRTDRGGGRGGPGSGRRNSW